MKFSTTRIIAIIIILGFSRLSSAQNIPPAVTDTYVDNLITDTDKYIGHYMDPFLKGLGYGFNNGWYNTAKPHKSFGFDLTISANAAYVPEIDQSFTLVPGDYNAFTTIDGNNTDLPTVMGGTTTTEIRSYLAKDDPDPVLSSLYVQVPVLDGIRDRIPINALAVPSVIVQLGVGIYKGTEVKVRWVPTIQNDEGLDYKYFGLGVMHSVSQWVPVLSDLKFLDVSGFIGFTNISVVYDLPPGDPFAGVDQKVDFGVNTITYEVVGSATVSVITGFVGLGFDNFKTNLDMLGQYDIRIPGTDVGSGETIQTLNDPITLAAKHNGFRATVGARLKLAILTLHAAYTLQEYNTLNAGIGFSFR